MNAARWTRIQALFDEALQRPPDTRTAFLRSACGNDNALRREVESLLDADAAPHRLFNSDALDAVDLPADALPSGIVGPVEHAPAEGYIGPYRIQRPLGAGGMGAVYLADRADGHFSHTVALKLLRDARASPALVRRFEAERQILARLHHPAIGRLYDGGVTDDGRPYLVMEYVNGMPITDYADACNASVDERLRLVRTVCTAVQYAHSCLVVHRDLKPSNILVTEDETVKLLDFGIAKVLAETPTGAPDDDSNPLTRTGQAVLTPAYAAPEQVQRGPVTTATDVYTLGVLLYELLTGRRPFDWSGRSPAEMEHILTTEVPPAPSTVAPPDRARRIRGDLDRICRTALRPEPDRRYATAQQLADDLTRVLTHQPIRARPDSALYRTRKFLQRNRGPVSAAAGVALLIAVLVGFYTTRLAAERDRARTEAATAAQVSGFLQSLFAVADPHTSGQRDVTAAHLLQRGAARINADLANQPAVQARLMQVMGEAYQGLGTFDAAAPLLERALALRQASLPPEHPEVAGNLHSLAVFHQETGAYARADSLYQAALTLHRRGRAPDTTVAAVMHNWGTLLHFQGQHDRADSLYQAVLALRIRHLGRTHPQTVHTLNEQASLHYDRGDLDAAEALYREVVTLRTAHYAGDHPDVADGHNNLAMVLRHKGDYEAARPLYESALAMRTRLFGTPHPDVAHTLNHLSRLHYNQGNYDAAAPLARRALAMRRALFGDAHMEVAASMGSLAGTLTQQGKLQDAADLYREALDITRTLLGPDHAYTAAFTYSLASVVHRQGDLVAADSLYRVSLRLHRRALPKNHVRLALPLLRRGMLLLEQGQPDDAEGLLREAVQIRLNTLGPKHWRVATAESALGEAFAHQGRPDEARPLLQRSLEVLENTFGPEDARVITARERLQHLD